MKIHGIHRNIELFMFDTTNTSQGPAGTPFCLSGIQLRFTVFQQLRLLVNNPKALHSFQKQGGQEDKR